MPVREIALLGNPVLRQKCRAVASSNTAVTLQLVRDLADTLHDFRARKGFGRGIAAPQIGSTERVIFVDYEYSGPLINPRIVRRSRKRFVLWDDCFSFPDLLVKVQRHVGIEVEFLDGDGRKRTLTATGGLSELLQHEIDHLDGILAIDRAIDSRHIILRSEFEKLSQRDFRAL
jgi:peptide deformylase